MKKILFPLLFLVAGLAANAQAQAKDEPKVIRLDQTSGQFVQAGLNLAPGKYIFEISNQNVGKDVGFYLHTEGSKASVAGSDKAGLIKNNEVKRTEVVELKTGEYIYMCPLNPTPEYKIVVK
jgi:hypothetical protein